jgi:hypothetical protein
MKTARQLHVVNGGYKANSDKEVIERASRDNRMIRSWIVPKSAQIGDEVVINIDRFGLFATAKIASSPTPRRDWPGNRYGATLQQIKLIKPPISIREVQRYIPNWGWARFRRSITTPKLVFAESVRDLVKKRRLSGLPDIDDESIDTSSIDELREIAMLRARPSLPPKVRRAIYRASSKAIRKYALKRASGHCEGCGCRAPFLGKTKEPYLEVHHTLWRADDGPDDPNYVIALCPNCHRRTEFGSDAKVFNASLIRKLAKIELKLRRS